MSLQAEVRSLDGSVFHACGAATVEDSVCEAQARPRNNEVAVCCRALRAETTVSATLVEFQHVG